MYATESIVIVSIVDAWKGRHRDWLHWIGVATYIVNSIVAVVWIKVSHAEISNFVSLNWMVISPPAKILNL